MTVPAPRSPDVRVLVVDDAPAFRAAAAAVLARTPGFTVIGEAPDGATALERAAQLGPELVLLDIHLPDTDGIAVCAQLLRRFPPPRVLLCSTYAVADLPPRALTCGALGYLPKDGLRPSVLRALWAAALTPPAGRLPG
jgi:DNA-binding NarL/FixJ family response regulator